MLQLNEPVNIFDEQAFQKVVDEHGPAKSTAAKADTIAHATKRAISERLEQDPAFYTKFSKLIQQAIDDYRAKRISDLEYLKRVGEIRDAVVHRKRDDVPASLKDRDDATAEFGILKPYVSIHVDNDGRAGEIAAGAAVAIWDLILRNRKVGYWDDVDAQRQTMNEIDDYLYDELKGRQGIALTTVEMDEIIEKTMQLARHRMPE